MATTKPEDVRALIARARELDTKATPGPWTLSDYWEVHAPHKHHGGCEPVYDDDGTLIDGCENMPTVVVETDGGYYLRNKEDGRFFADSRQLVPQLADACEQLLDLVRRLQWGTCEPLDCLRPSHCSLCSAKEPGPHAPDCPIAALGLPAEDS